MRNTIAKVYLAGATALAILMGWSPAVAQTTEIVYWDFIQPGDGSPRGNALQKNLKAFEAQNPNIKVKVEVLAPSMIDPNLIQGSAAGRSPDVVRVDTHYLPRHVKAGSVQPLDKFVKPDDKNDWLLPWDGSLFDGKKYALPYEHRMHTLMYRKDLLAKANVAVPTTWKEICEAGGKLSTASVMGYAMGLSQSDSANALLELTENVVLDAGSKLFDDSGKAIFNNDAGLKFFQLVSDLATTCKATGPTVVEFTYNALGEGLASGTIAMTQQGTHRYLAIAKQGAGENLGWAPPPSFVAGKPAPVHVLGWTLAMGSKAKQPEAAWKFMQFMTSPAAQLTLAEGGELPVRKSVYEDAFFKSPSNKFMADWSEYLAKQGVVAKYPENWFNFGQILAQSMQGMIINKTPPKDVLKSVVDSYNAAN